MSSFVPFDQPKPPKYIILILSIGIRAHGCDLGGVCFENSCFSCKNSEFVCFWSKPCIFSLQNQSFHESNLMAGVIRLWFMFTKVILQKKDALISSKMVSFCGSMFLGLQVYFFFKNPFLTVKSMKGNVFMVVYVLRRSLCKKNDKIS